MKGIRVDCKTGRVKEFDDGLPEPSGAPIPEPVGLDLAEVVKRLKKIEDALDEHDRRLKRDIGGHTR